MKIAYSSKHFEMTLGGGGGAVVRGRLISNPKK